MAALAAAAAGLAVPATARAEAFRKGPYLQNVTQHSVTVMWESGERQPGQVEIAGLRTVDVASEELHEVVVDGLEPGRRYRYRVDCAGETADGEFATAPEAGSPFSFVVFGDTRSMAGSHLRVIERIHREVPDFILGTGDMVDMGARDDQWQQFFDIEGPLLRENVLFPSLGNHDRQGAGRTADAFRKYFSLPENSPNPERYYAFTYGNARFLILDSNAYAFALTDQTAWIERELQEARLDPKIRHIFVSMHHPPFSISLHGGRTELRDAWTPLYEKYGVTAVFSGHDHCYERAERNGVRYFVSGGGGAPLYPRARAPSPIDVESVAYFERVNHYLRVVVMGDLIEVSAIRADGSLIETTTWGTAPRLPEAPLVATGRPAVHAAGAPAPDTVRETGAAGSHGRRFGVLGVLGGVVILAAAAALVLQLRR